MHLLVLGSFSQVALTWYGFNVIVVCITVTDFQCTIMPCCSDFIIQELPNISLYGSFDSFRGLNFLYQEFSAPNYYFNQFPSLFHMTNGYIQGRNQHF